MMTAADPSRSHLHPSYQRPLLLQTHRQLWKCGFWALSSLKGEETRGQIQENKGHSKTHGLNYMFREVQITCDSRMGKWTEIKCHKYPWNTRGSEPSSDPLVLFFIGIWVADWTELGISRNFYWIYLWTILHVTETEKSLYISFIPSSDFISVTRTLKPRFAKLCILIAWWPFPYFEQANANEKNTYKLPSPGTFLQAV